jgi:hypothetical protein
MDGMQREELERLMFFEQTREKAAAGYARNPKDADVDCLYFFFVFFGFFFGLLNFFWRDLNLDLSTVLSF